MFLGILLSHGLKFVQIENSSLDTFILLDFDAMFSCPEHRHTLLIFKNLFQGKTQISSAIFSNFIFLFLVNMVSFDVTNSQLWLVYRMKLKLEYQP